MKQNKIVRAAATTVAVAAICLAATVATAPLLAPVVFLLATAGKVATVQPALLKSAGAFFSSDDKLGYCLQYAAALMGSGLGSALAIVFVFYAAMALLLGVRYIQTNPNRELPGGVLGKQKAYSGTLSLLKHCKTWDGESEPPDGVVVGFVGKRAVIFNCHHAAICAPSGSLKSRGSVDESVDALSYTGRNNLIVTDPSLEIYIASRPCLESRGYSVALLDLVEPRHGQRFNPLKLITDLFESGDRAAAEARAREVGDVLFPDSGGDNAIFAKAAGGAFSAVAYAVAASPGVPDGARNVASVIDAVVAGTVNGSGALKDWLRGFGAASPAVAMAATFLAAEGKFEASVLATLHDGLQPFSSRSMRWTTSASDIDIDAMMRGRSALFIRAGGPGSQANKVASLFLAQHWAETQRLGARRNLRPCTIVGDEFHSIPKFTTLVHAVEQARKYGLRYVMYLQSFSGLDQYMTRENGKDSILANCDLKVLYRAGSDKDAEYFERLSGFRSVLVENTGETRQGVMRGGSSQGFAEQKAPLWPAGDILERNPATDGALVIQAADGARPAGKFEVPIKDVSRTFTARHFGTIGTPEFELGVINRALDELDTRAASIPIEVEGWHPAEFDETEEGDDGENGAIEADEASAWDNVILA